MAIRIRRRSGWATTLDYLMGVPEFAAAFEQVRMPPWTYATGYDLWSEIALLRGVLQAAMRYEGLLLYTGRGRFKPEVLAVFFLSFLPRRWRPTIVLNGEAWEPNTGWRAALDRIIVRFADRAISRYALLSNDEQRLFPLVWGIDPSKVRFTPYMYTLTEEELQGCVETGTYIFAGGNSFRDYAPLVEAARMMPEHAFVLATRKLNGYPNLPPNVRAGQVPTDEYVRLLRGAALVVVPLRMGTYRASGQQTYLNAMALKKLVIVNDALGVRDYVRHGENGLVVRGTPESYVEALRWALDPDNKSDVERIIERAYRDVLYRFNPTHHAHTLISVMNEAVAWNSAYRSASESRAAR
ncbi:MAG: glycosyltransferase [Roseiflexus sp.]|nr:glycosyltransferase [Roseiflexus sp.]MCS7288642.1 glycosyltransferase [Roseiflexus sp.]MDW8146454.1 glycosyltransferase [Roseiflexaceae bacterium]MDW8234392.1 glycosyltransferase [Roseiflexaceae bacterium]